MPGIHRADDARNVQGGAQPPQKQGTFFGKIVSSVSSGVKHLLAASNQFHAEMLDIIIIGSNNLLNRTVDLPGYLKQLNGEDLQKVAESVLQDLTSGDSERVFQGAQVWVELLKLKIDGFDRSEKEAISKILDQVSFQEIFNVASEAFCDDLSPEVSNKAVGLLLDLAVLNKEASGKLVEWAGKQLRSRNASVVVQGRFMDLLLRLGRLDAVDLDHKTSAAIKVLRCGSTPELKDKAGDLLLDLARLDDASFNSVEAVLAECTRLSRSPDLKAKGVSLLLSMARLDTASLSCRVKAAGSALCHSSDEDASSEAANLLLDLARQDGAPLDKIAEAAKYKFRVPGSPQIQNTAGNLLLELVRLDESLLADIVDVASNTLSNNPTSGAADFLLNLARLDGLSLVNRVAAAGNVFLYGKIEEKVSQAIDQLSLLLDRDPANTDEIKKIIETLIFVVPCEFNGHPAGEALKDKSLNFLVEKVLRNDAFAGESDTLDIIVQAILSSLAGRDEDSRFQAAQVVGFHLMNPNDINNPYDIHKVAKEKKESLEGLNADYVEEHIPVSGDGYKLNGSYLQMTMPVPDPEDVPKTSYDELKALQEHLRAALAVASLEEKKRLLQSGDTEFLDEQVDGQIVFMLECFDIAIDSSLLKGWMTPQVGSKFNRTGYELQSIVEMIHQELKAWERDGGVYGEVLSVPAANMAQLMINITTCTSGKQAGVRLSAQQNKVPSPSNDDILRGQLPRNGKLEPVLSSQEESSLTLQSIVMNFIVDAYDVYQTFKSNLIDGDSDFIQRLTASNPVSQPSHQHDYAFHVLGNVLGLMVEGEIVPVDLYGGVVHENIRNASGEAMLKTCLSQEVGGKDVTDALIERFSHHWWNYIKEGATQARYTSGTANEAQKRYEDFIKFVEAMGLSIVEVLDYEEDDDYNMTFIGLKSEAVALMLEHLGILKKPD